MLIQAISILLLTLATGAPSLAQEPESANEDNLVVIYGRWPGKGECTPENTTPVTFANLLRDKEKYQDKCVSTVAWISGRALFLDRDDMSLQYSNSNEAAADRRVGLYGDDKSMERIYKTTATRARVVGKLWDCDDLNGPNVMMVLGYCHYTGGPIIGVASFHPLS